MSTADEEAKAKGEYYESPYIHTISGRFYLSRPSFDPRAIGHALGMLCRFNGNTRRFYSVAEHSVLVSDIMDKVVGGNPFEGLMHDAAVAYLSDIPTPFKRLLPDWKALERPVESSLREFFGLPLEKSGECEIADKLALFLEAIHLIPEGGADYKDPLNARPSSLLMSQMPEWQLKCWGPEHAGMAWYRRFHALCA